MVTDGLAVSIEGATVSLVDQEAVLELTIRYSLDKIERKFFPLWLNTGRI